MVDSEGIDLIVMNIHKKTAMERLSIGGTAEKIIRAANVPVLAVPSNARAPNNG
jgi:nucleotide-binding universal stress UspA family protein